MKTSTKQILVIFVITILCFVALWQFIKYDNKRNQPIVGTPCVVDTIFRINDSLSEFAITDTNGILLSDKVVFSKCLEYEINKELADICTPYYGVVTDVDGNKCLISIITEKGIAFQAIRPVCDTTFETLAEYYYNRRFATLEEAKQRIPQ